MLKRAMMAGLNAAGVNVLDLEVATVPVTRFHVRRPRAAGGVTVRLGRRRPAVGRDPLLRRRRHRHRRGRAAQDRAAVPPGGLPAGASPPRSATSASRPGPSSTTPPPSMRHGRHRGDPRPRRSSWCSTTRFGVDAFVMPNVLAKLGADVLAVNPYASTGRRRSRSTRAEHADGVADAGARVGRPPRRGASTPTASASPSSTTRATCSPTTRRCWRSSRWCPSQLLGDRGRPAGRASAGRRSASPRRTACEIVVDQAVHRRS